MSVNKNNKIQEIVIFIQNDLTVYNNKAKIR